jgi:hypothetical protein
MNSGSDKRECGQTGDVAGATARTWSAGVSRRLGLAVVGLLTAALCAPFLRTIVGLSDEGVLLHGADRILRGERLYRDFFEFLPPGGFLLTASWLGTTGISLASAHVLTIFTIVGIACFTYLACHQASRSAAASATATLAWVVMSQGYWTQVNHHWFATLFCVVVFWAVLAWIEKPQWRWLVVAGLAGGGAAMVTPTYGALALLAGLTAFNRRPHFAPLVVYSLTAIVVPFLLVLYVIAHGALSAAFDSVIIYTATRYSGIQGVPYGSFAHPQNILLNFVFPLAAVLAVVHAARDWRAALRDGVLRVSAAFGLAGFFAILVRPATAQIAFAAPLALPLLLRCGSSLKLGTMPRLRLVVLAVAALLAGVPVGAFLNVAYLAVRSPAIETPRGNVKLLVSEPGTQAMILRIMNLPAGDTVFFYPFNALLPFLTARVHPARFDVFVPKLYDAVAI